MPGGYPKRPNKKDQPDWLNSAFTYKTNLPAGADPNRAPYQPPYTGKGGHTQNLGYTGYKPPAASYTPVFHGGQANYNWSPYNLNAPPSGSKTNQNAAAVTQAHKYPTQAQINAYGGAYAGMAGAGSAPPTDPSQMTQADFQKWWQGLNYERQGAYLLANNAGPEGWSAQKNYALTTENLNRLAENAGKENPFEGAGYNIYGQPAGTEAPIINAKRNAPAGSQFHSARALNRDYTSEELNQMYQDTLNMVNNYQWRKKPGKGGVDQNRQYALLKRRLGILQGYAQSKGITLGSDGGAEGTAPGWVSAQGKWNP